VEAETVTTYRLYYDTPNTFGHYDDEWHLLEEFETLEEALNDIAAEKEDDAELGAEFRYKVVERSVTLRTVYQEVE
jgi:hypothetical protein